jgi:hypothetical protein
MQNTHRQWKETLTGYKRCHGCAKHTTNPSTALIRLFIEAARVLRLPRAQAQAHGIVSLRSWAMCIVYGVRIVCFASQSGTLLHLEIPG